jgi:hypothetical protein
MRSRVAETLPETVSAPAASALRSGPGPGPEEKAAGLYRQFCGFTFSVIRDSLLWQLAQVKPALVTSTHKLVWKRSWGSDPVIQKHLSIRLADICVTLGKLEPGPPAVIATALRSGKGTR